jgi:hypothetical protein
VFGDECAIDDVGEPAFEAAQGFFRCLALEAFAFVVGPAGRARVADLGHGHHVQRVVQTPVSGPGEPMPDLLAGGGIDGCGAVVGGEVILGREPVDRFDLGEDAAGDDRADAVELGQVRAGAHDQGIDLPADSLHLRVQGSDVVQVLVRELQPHQRDRLLRPQFVQQLLGSGGLQAPVGATRGEFG